GSNDRFYWENFWKNFFFHFFITIFIFFIIIILYIAIIFFFARHIHKTSTRIAMCSCDKLKGMGQEALEN
ncbi:MAG: hypothetical protein D3907_04155, partial [Candidatus Electrothrix sp. AUS3]|nr:hypothetical protein [Candidatus Electrothrix gigas]